MAYFLLFTEIFLCHAFSLLKTYIFILCSGYQPYDYNIFFHNSGTDATAVIVFSSKKFSTSPSTAIKDDRDDDIKGMLWGIILIIGVLKTVIKTVYTVNNACQFRRWL